MLMLEIGRIPLYAWILALLLVIPQGTWLFIDARKQGQYPWFWGIWGMISFPLPTILYLIFVRKVLQKLWRHRKGV